MRYFALPLLLLSMTSVAPAQDWARRMFDHTEFNFGTIARGAKAEHRFTFENIYREDVHVASATSSCGCTRPTLTRDLLRSLEKGEVVATIDTRSFMGHKEAAIKIRIDQPFPAEVILKVSCYIRSDVVVQPGSIDFGSVPQGASVERDVSVDYAGRSDWRVTAVEVSNPYFDVHMVETGRDQGQVKYSLSVKLRPNTPAGYIKDQLVLVTNDTNERAMRVPVPVEAAVIPSMTVRPSPLLLGVVNMGQTVTKHLVAQSQSPFSIAAVQCADPRFRFEIPPGAKSLHLIPVTFAADNHAGNVSEVIHIRTDSSANPIDVSVTVRVVDSRAAALPGLPEWAPSNDKPQDKAKPAVTSPSPVKEQKPAAAPSLVPVQKSRSSRREL